ncbi:SAM-dependent methyltransferase [Pseudonocardia humida]|uniref:SAM-dependent methyltransferase n=1 Tax=Pseudonocardia humida TaxID=2800819 RepID=UPI00207C346E|nr:SAM-dependent methyltransferase [Pseudonocardia humida]
MTEQGDTGGTWGDIDPDPGVELDQDRPQSARVWNYWLGGKDNYAIDREVGEQIRAMLPGIVDIARADRAFLLRAVRHLVADCGVRQFLDIGTGLPSANNTHEVAQSIAPECRIVYVDNDPLVLAHARSLLTSSPEGATRYLDADVREPDVILEQAAHTLDFAQPIALMMLGIVNHIMDDAEAERIVERLVAALAPGSYLVLAHPTADIDGDAMRKAMTSMNESGGTPVRARTRGEVERFFRGLELLEPGIVTLGRWRPDPVEVGGVEDVVDVSEYCGVARKP